MAPYGLEEVDSEGDAARKWGARDGRQLCIAG